MNKTRLFYTALLILAWVGHNACAEKGDVSVDIKTGNISTLAIGDDANASVSIGGIPSTIQNGCTQIHIEHGNLKRIAIGKNANASIQLPDNQNTCKEK